MTSILNLSMSCIISKIFELFFGSIILQLENNAKAISPKVISKFNSEVRIRDFRFLYAINSLLVQLI